MASKLYQPCKIGATTIANRMAMAPLTRCRSTNAEHKATDLMVEYYSQRASIGLIIAECTAVCRNASAFYNDPGIYEDAQIEGWKKVTDAVHEKGGKIFLQIWHGGRACPAEYNNGQQAVSASALPIPHRYNSAIQGQLVASDTPRALADEEVKGIVKAFADGAKRSIAAGFDGVELHGANGYLLNQFLVPAVNKRTAAESDYSGETIETRARFMLEAVDACASAIGKDRVGIRLSPFVSFQEAAWENPAVDIPYVASELNKREIAFIHVERRDLFAPNRDKTIDATPLFRKHFNYPGSTIITNVDFERAEAEAYVDKEKSDADVIAFGVPILANPDLVRRFIEKRDGERNAPLMDNFYTPGPKGYTDYPFLA